MTAMLRTTARTIALCALAMLMTGCIKVDLNMELHGDNTVGGTMVFAVSRDLLALTGSSADDLLGQITASAHSAIVRAVTRSVASIVPPRRRPLRRPTVPRVHG